MSGKDPFLGVDLKLESLGAVPLRKNSALMKTSPFDDSRMKRGPFDVVSSRP